jgi:hypothetical protein
MIIPPCEAPMWRRDVWRPLCERRAYAPESTNSQKIIDLIRSREQRYALNATRCAYALAVVNPSVVRIAA